MAPVQRAEVVAHSVQVIDHTINHLSLSTFSIAQYEVAHIEALGGEVDMLSDLFA